MRRILLLGAGYMAKEYAKVLKALNIEFEVVGRGEKGCSGMSGLFPGSKVYSGGVENFGFHNQYSHAIVATSVESLASNAICLIRNGFKNILIEKPGGVNSAEIKALADQARQNNASVFLAYNRRFYASVLAAMQYINDDGGVTSFNFEFTEWPQVVLDQPVPFEVKNNWVIANSSHVIDTAFFLGGKPIEMCSYSAGGLDWHTASSVFAGAGITDTNALFSYSANWEAPGRWVLEFLTRKRRFIFKPMEKLQVQKLGSVVIDPVTINDGLDLEFKPGLYLQTRSFLNGETRNFCGIEDQRFMTSRFYCKMAGYSIDKK